MGEARSCKTHMGSCQNYGPFLGTLNIRCRIMIGIEKGTIILTTTHLVLELKIAHLCALFGAVFNISSPRCRVEGLGFRVQGGVHC